MTLVNSPIEVSMRVLVVLDREFPELLSSVRLSMLDYALVHAGDLGGPPSLHPDIPGRIGELGIRKQLVDEALRILLRVGLAEVQPTSQGIGYRASEGAQNFLDLLTAQHIHALRSNADWIHSRYSHMPAEGIRNEMYKLVERWSDQFETRDRL